MSRDSPPASPTYPQDICNLVIDELQVHRPTLQNCSIISRPWLHPSRIHLLREIAISIGDSSDPKDIVKFTNALMTQSTEFAYYIRSLVIEGYAISGRLSRPRLYSSLPLGDLFAILDQLPRLNLLTLDHAKFYSGGPDVTDLVKYSSLEAFRFKTTFQEGPYDYKSLFLQLLLHFPNVTDLDLSLHSSPSLDEYPITFPHKHLRQKIKSLKLEASAAQGPVLKSLFNIVCFSELRSIEVVGTTSSLVYPLGQIVSAASETLEKFSYQMHDVAISSWSILNLSTCKSLTSVSLTVPLTYSAHATQDRWNAAVSVLSTLLITATHPLSIEIIFMVETHQYWDILEAFTPTFGYLSWSSAREIMNKLNKLNLLFKLEFIITTPNYPLVDDIPADVVKVCQLALKMGFPELDEKDRLSVNYSPAAKFIPDEQRLHTVVPRLGEEIA
ncbi:hypothetical protein QCA50_004661 [Cerrena zonata]|uniref:Uncharacterized protein n=1 Tax=Cerrena zonata TaxID=2478898 RepID=A0AAW0GCK4_9APHY